MVRKSDHNDVMLPQHTYQVFYFSVVDFLQDPVLQILILADGRGLWHQVTVSGGHGSHRAGRESI